jgi:hypothetical protein
MVEKARCPGGEDLVAFRFSLDEIKGSMRNVVGETFGLNLPAQAIVNIKEEKLLCVHEDDADMVSIIIMTQLGLPVEETDSKDICEERGDVPLDRLRLERGRGF